MTLKKAQAVNGLRYETIDFDGAFIVQAWDGENLVAAVGGKRLPEVIKQLVEKVYRVWSREVMAENEWRCLVCGRKGSLEIDHIVARSKGRNDRKTNLRPVCAGIGGCDFHRKRHGG